MQTRRKFIHTSLMSTALFFTPGFFTSYEKNMLPRVLIIGDSISIGYTPFVRDFLDNKAKVHRPMHNDGQPENCQGTTSGVKNIDRWINEKEGDWDVIHFNFGLHDIKHVDPKTGANSNNPEHPQQANLQQYEKNLKKIVKKLRKTGAKLIFATTTPYPDKVSGPLREPGMPQKYNEVAVKIMQQNDIEINDLHGFVYGRMKELQIPNNVHFTEKGSKALGNVVAEKISNVL